MDEKVEFGMLLFGAAAADPAAPPPEGAAAGLVLMLSCDSDLMMEPKRAAWSPTVSSGLEVRRVPLEVGGGFVAVEELWEWRGERKNS